MKIRVNGKEQTFDGAQVFVGEMLKICKVSQPDMVSVQLNGEFVKRENYGATVVQEGDEVDFLYFMGGGAPAARQT